MSAFKLPLNVPASYNDVFYQQVFVIVFILRLLSATEFTSVSFYLRPVNSQLKNKKTFFSRRLQYEEFRMDFNQIITPTYL